MIDLTGKVALVTGATRGIGCEIAKLLVARGAIVIGSATTDIGVQTINNYLTPLCSAQKSTGVKLDVTKLNDIEEVFKLVVDKFGIVDILVNNAGITRDNLLMRMKNDEWDDIIDTNLTPIFHTSKTVLRGMIKKRFGRIINIGSVVGSMGNAGQANYAAAKAGVIGFTKSMAKEVASRGITVNAISPGFIQTDMTDVLTDEQRSATLSNIPANRLGSAEEIAAAVAFLASNEAAYITGETLHINGGMYMN